MKSIAAVLLPVCALIVCQEMPLAAASKGASCKDDVLEDTSMPVRTVSDGGRRGYSDEESVLQLRRASSAAELPERKQDEARDLRQSSRNSSDARGEGDESVGTDNIMSLAAEAEHVTVFPTKCPAGMPELDSFWAQESSEHKVDKAHCNLATCDTGSRTTNWNRFSTLRALLKATDALMRKQVVDYTVISGTLIGAERCADVLPWDDDADIQILESDRTKLDVLFEESGGSRALDFIGHPNFTLFGMETCIPFRVVDTVTGFYVDVFAPRLVQNKMVSSYPMYSGKEHCDPPKDYAESGWPAPYWKKCTAWRKCHNIPTDVIWPSKRCRFADFEVNCPADNVAYLSHLFPDASHPNVWTRD